MLVPDAQAFIRGSGWKDGRFSYPSEVPEIEVSDPAIAAIEFKLFYLLVGYAEQIRRLSDAAQK
jgi:hypothetical protein